MGLQALGQSVTCYRPEPQGFISCPRKGVSTQHRSPGACRKESWPLSTQNQSGSPAWALRNPNTTGQTWAPKNDFVKLNRCLSIPPQPAQPGWAFNCSSMKLKKEKARTAPAGLLPSIPSPATEKEPPRGPVDPAAGLAAGQCSDAHGPRGWTRGNCYGADRKGSVPSGPLWAWGRGGRFYTSAP